MSDRLAVMREGQIEQVGTPQDVYNTPVSTYVADFLGLANLLPATVSTAGTIEMAGRSIDVPTGDVVGDCTVFVRPERLRIVDAGHGLIQGPVTDVVFVGAATHVRIDVDGSVLQLVLPNDGTTSVPAPGTIVGVAIPPSDIRPLVL